MIGPRGRAIARCECYSRCTTRLFSSSRRLGLHWLDDLSGLRIGAGPRAGTGGTYVPEILNALGIKASVRFGAMESIGAQLTAGDLDGAVFASLFQC
jgi:TRAP-type uncharacterized transport system substrate-binding protein